MPDGSIGQLSRDQLRSRRKRAVRARTLEARHISKRELERGKLLYPDDGEPRPKTRGDCIGGPRPCPYVACRYNLYLDATAAGGIKLNFPDLEPDEMVQSCCLDVADAAAGVGGGLTLEQVAELMNLTRERGRQLEESAVRRLRVFMPHELNVPHEVPRGG